MDIGTIILIWMLVALILTILLVLIWQDSYNRSLKKLISFLTIKKPSSFMLNTKALGKALTFLCLPTLSVLFVMYFWFFDWTAFTHFVTSPSVWASLLRVAILIAEFALVYNMYLYYCKLYPNDKANGKLYDQILGDKFQRRNRLYKGSGKEDRLRTDYEIERILASLLHCNTEETNEKEWEIHAYTLPQYKDTIILKRINE